MVSYWRRLKKEISRKYVPGLNSRPLPSFGFCSLKIILLHKCKSRHHNTLANDMFFFPSSWNWQMICFNCCELLEQKILSWNCDLLEQKVLSWNLDSSLSHHLMINIYWLWHVFFLFFLRKESGKPLLF